MIVTTGCILLLGLLSLSDARPQNHIAQVNEGEVIEGDILVTERLKKLIEQPQTSGRSRREITTDAVKLWQNGIVPYTIDKRLGKSARKAIRKAIREYHKKTCVRFVTRSTQPDFVHFSLDYGCYSPIGRQGGRQKLSVGEGCEYRGTVMHELMHALGFFHEHSRHDRDKYVKILWWNIEPGFFNNFNVYSHSVLDTLNAPYDYHSLMHYDKQAFSKNRQNTIEALDNPTRKLGQMDDFSETDINQLLKVYPCKPGTERPVLAQPKVKSKVKTMAPKHLEPCTDVFPAPCKLFSSHINYCSDWKTFMGKNCPLSCGFCQQHNEKQKLLEANATK